MLKEVEFTMDEGRDAGKTFKIKEMPAYQMDKWVTRLLGCFAKENITMVVVTHEMGFAKQVADRVIFMEDGQIIESGTPEHFFNNPESERVKQFLGKIIR